MQIQWNDKTYEFGLDKILLSQAKIIKARLGLTIMGIEKGLNEADADALQALYWLMLQNAGEVVEITNVEFDIVAFFKAIQVGVDKQAEADKAAKKAPAPKAKV